MQRNLILYLVSLESKLTNQNLKYMQMAPCSGSRDPISSELACPTQAGISGIYGIVGIGSYVPTLHKRSQVKSHEFSIYPKNPKNPSGLASMHVQTNPRSDIPVQSRLSRDGTLEPDEVFCQRGTVDMNGLPLYWDLLVAPELRRIIVNISSFNIRPQCRQYQC